MRKAKAGNRQQATGNRDKIVAGLRFALCFHVFMALFSSFVYAQEAYFSLSSSDIYASGSKPTISVYSTQIPSIEFRLYKLDNPVAFFKAQDNYHNPVAQNSPRYNKEASRNIMDSTQGLLGILQRRYRNVFRTVIKQDLRQTLVSNEVIKKAQKDVVKYAKFPVLKEYSLLKTWVYKTNKKRNATDEYGYERVPVPVNGKGVYLIEGVHGNFVAYTVVLVTDIRFIAKESPGAQFVFVCDSKTGKPLASASVVFVKKKADEEDENFVPETVAMKTDKSGIASVKKNDKNNYKFLIQNGKDFLLSEPYSYSSGDDKNKVYIYTDRPVYRPGQKVHFKALFRQKEGTSYALLSGSEVEVNILDSSDNKLLEKKFNTNNWGAIEGEMDLPDEPPTGRYSIEVHIGDEHDDSDVHTYYGQFDVEEYKKPEYKITLTSDKKSYVSGDEVKVNVNAKYYFGEPVKDAKVSYFIYKSRYSEPWWEDYAYSWYFAGSDGYSYYDFQLENKGSGELNEKGEFSFPFKADTKGDDAIYKIEAKVEDKSRHEVDGRIYVKVAQGLFRISIDTDNYGYARGDTMRLAMQTKNLEGIGVSAPVRVEVIKEDWVWQKARKEERGKYENGKWVYKESVVLRRNVKTSKAKTVTVNIPANDNGSFRITAMSKDKRGNIIRSETYVYVTDRHYSFYSNTKDIVLKPDKKIYGVGDTAKMLAMFPSANVHALVTVEGDYLYEMRVVDVKKSSALLEFPVKEVYAPNVFVKVQYVFNGEFYSGDEELVAPPEDKFLNVEVTTDKETYQPGDKVKVRVRVTDARGNPVDADVSAGIVDESIYAIREENVEDIREFFYDKRWNKVETSYPYDFYFSGYSVAKEPEMVKAKRDTISWADLKGKQNVKVRKKFMDTMFWQASAYTGSDGTVELDAPCPDNLTTWRITVRASTKNTQVGQTKKTFITRKNLILRLALPRFFRERDTLTFQAIVHNYLSSAKNVRVKLEAEGVKLGESLNQTLTVPKGGDKALSFHATALSSAENVVLRAWAETDEESDALEMTLPLLPHGVKRVKSYAASSRETQWKKQWAVNFPDNTVKNTRRLRLSFSPSLMGPIYASLGYLVNFPYGCTEQTMSSFLPAVLVANMVKELGLPLDEKLKEKLPQVLYKGLNRLYDYQHEDGGWGWWEHDETDTFMTAYVIYGLSLAKKGGTDIRDGVLENGKLALYNLLSKESVDLTTRLYILYVMSLSGENNTSMIEKIYNEKALWKKTNGYGLSLMALTLKQLGLEKEAKEVSRALLKRVISSQGLSWWEGKHSEYSWEDDTVETTAFALKALVNTMPENEHVARAITYLMAQRKGDHWKSTKDTAQVIHAIVDYIRYTGELSADFTVQVKINVGAGSEPARTIKSISFGKSDALKEGIDVELAGKAINTANTVDVVKNGKGMLYANILQVFYTDEENIVGSGNGFKVKKEFFLLKARRLNDEAWEYVPEKLPSGGVHIGDEILVKLTLTAGGNQNYFMLEDFLPSGCEVVKDMSGYNIRGYAYKEEDDYEWSYFWSHQDFRDEKVSYFVTRVPKGTHTFTYILRPEMAGKFHVMPAEGSLMYYPQMTSRSSELFLNVGE